MSSVCEMMFYLCLRMRNGNHSTRCWELVSLEARVSRATAQGCVFNYRVPRNPSLGCHKQQLLSWAWEPDLDCFIRGRSPREHTKSGSELGLLSGHSWAALRLEDFWLSWNMSHRGPALPAHKIPGPSAWSSPSGLRPQARSPKWAAACSGISCGLKGKL